MLQDMPVDLRELIEQGRYLTVGRACDLSTRNFMAPPYLPPSARLNAL
jgi:hypothetical protein